MRRLLAVVLTILSFCFSWALAATDVWCPHVTACGGWKTELSLYTAGTSPAQFQIERYDASGNAVGSSIQGMAAAKGWTPIPPTSLAYEGTARITSSRELLVKAAYRLGDSPSVCEFYLTGAAGTAWVLPNALHDWMSYTGLAVVNAGNGPVTITLEAWKNQAKAAADATVTVGAKSKFVGLSEQVWPGVAYANLDTVIVRSASAVPAPICITGNAAGDRSLFFTAQPEPATGTARSAGDLVTADPIVGNLRYVPAGTFTQGTAATEPCRDGDETQFAHTLTKSLAVMETETTRQMWANLKAVQPTLPEDPTNTALGSGMANPAQNNSWYEAILFANLLSAQQGLTLCYYADAGFVVPITSANYRTSTVYCNWAASGYRLPTEGEWEYFCRAGTTGPFWIIEPNYSAANCGTESEQGMYPQLETTGWFWGNASVIYASSPVGQKMSNPWNLKDVYGNVWEWCWDWYAAYPTGSATDYRGAAAGTIRVNRGGGWHDSARSVRSALRNAYGPSLRGGNLGFRLVRSLP